VICRALDDSPGVAALALVKRPKNHCVRTVVALHLAIHRQHPGKTPIATADRTVRAVAWAIGYLFARLIDPRDQLVREGAQIGPR
jgi:hypothetical protein